LTVSPAQFADELQQIHLLGLRTIGIGELTKDLATRRSTTGTVLLTFDDGYSDQFRYAFPILQRFGERAAFFVNTATIGTQHHLSWHEVETMAQAGMSIGCHGVDHANLAALAPEAQRYEIETCLRVLRAHLHGPVIAYAYPSGYFDAYTIELERRSGLLFGFTTDPRFQTDAQSPYQIGRRRILPGMSDAEFGALLARPRGYVDFGREKARDQTPGS
jgi:peptidoglycan/xylan/chitin deacetylase (PgdA/CDA1 family)